MPELFGVLSFEPLIRVLPWGGRRLGSVLHKSLPPDEPCGESWEIVDLPAAQSMVSETSLSGQTLGSLVRKNPAQLLGNSKLLQGRFPVLFKFIDAAQTLSVQVHPDAKAAARLADGARPKTEAWYILDAEPGAKLYLGLDEGVRSPELSAALKDGTVANCLHEVDAVPGQFYFLPAGLLHAIGGGIVLAEIQQASDTTYRVFDWNRVGLDGNPRQLHIRQALESVDYDLRGQVAVDEPVSGRPGIKCSAFCFEKVESSDHAEVALEAGNPRIVACIDGQGLVEGAGGESMVLSLGQSCLVPASFSAMLSCDAGSAFLLIRA